MGDKWRVSINATKSTAVVFSRSRKIPDRLRVNRTWIPWDKNVKYLGLYMDRRLSWRTHLDYVANRIRNRLQSLRPLLFSRRMTRRLGQLIVSTYVLPLVTFAIPVWGYIAKTYRKRIQGLLDRGLRWATKAYMFTSYVTIRNAQGVRSLNSTISRLSKKFYRRAARFEGNLLISGLGQYQPAPGDSWNRPLQPLQLA